MRMTTAAPRTWEARLLVGVADREGVALQDPLGSSAAVLDAFQTGDLSLVAHVRSISTLLGEVLVWAPRELGRFTGMLRVPRITMLEGDTRGVPTPEDLLTRMASLEALARLGPEAQTCEVDLHTLGVSATRSPEAPRVPEGRWGLKEGHGASMEDTLPGDR